MWGGVLEVEEIKCEQVAQITDSGFTEMTGRVYSQQGLCPSIRTFAGGNTEVKVMEEPKIIQRPHGYNQGAELEDCPSITVSSWQENNLLKEPIIYGDYNGRIKADQSVIGTLTTNCGNDAERNGVKIIEPLERFYKQAFETAQENDCQDGDIIDAYNKRVSKEGITPTVTTRPEGFKTAILPMQNYRIRKLTPKECFRLMGVKDEDYKRVAKNQSNSSLYHLAGDSIVVNVLMALFNQML